jgi:hypothetical protein
VAVIRQTGRATSETGRESLMRSATVPRALDRGERFRRGRHRVALVVAATAVPVLLLAPPLHVAAQAGTPVAVAPGRCEVEPRSAADLAALAGATPRPAETAPATPETPPLAPPDVVSGVAATMAELAACTNAGEAARALALFSDDLFLAFFGGLSAEDLGTMLTPVAAVPLEDPIAEVSVEDVRLLPDGRVSAIARFDGVPSRVVLVRVGDRDQYRIDAIDDAPVEATPVP